MGSSNVIIIIVTLLTFVGLGFMMHRSIKKYDARPKTKGKKGKMKYMSEAKKPGR
ncbi:MAG: hypothetical protein N3I35_12965 [Clostridia bacterium]|nr:hypothetical protein [Clostridia bacterium]